MDPFINGIHQVSSLYRNFGEKKNTCQFFFSQESLLTRHLVAFVKINSLELGYIKEITTICLNSLQTMSDKSS